MRRCLALGLALASYATLAAQSPAPPHLRKQGTATQLVVDGRPFLIRGGELGNSSASNLDYLAPYWLRFRALRLNTILTPIYWDLLEPEEGHFDFALVWPRCGSAHARPPSRLALVRHLEEQHVGLCPRVGEEGSTTVSAQR
jgi:hypothetical protein